MKKLFFLPIFLVGVLIIFFFKSLSHEDVIPSALTDMPLPKSTVNGLDNKSYNFSNVFYDPDSYSLINVWASWCDNCVNEHLFITELAQEIKIFGLNYKDTVNNANDWLRNWGNPYTLIVSDVAGKLSFDLGVYSVPQTFLIDKHGIIRYRYAGVLNQDIWDRKFKPLIKRLEGEF